MSAPLPSAPSLDPALISLGKAAWVANEMDQGVNSFLALLVVVVCLGIAYYVWNMCTAKKGKKDPKCTDEQKSNNKIGSAVAVVMALFTLIYVYQSHNQYIADQMAEKADPNAFYEQYGRQAKLAMETAAVDSIITATGNAMNQN